MNFKLVELMELFPEMIRYSIIVAWGMAVFSLLASPRISEGKRWPRKVRPGVDEALRSA
jgi:hypothetical protein